MRIALFNIDSLASNTAVRKLIERSSEDLVFVGFSPPFRRSRGSALAQRWQHIKRSGLGFSSFLAYNFQIPRHVGRFSPVASTLHGLCLAKGIRAELIEDVNSIEVQQLMSELEVDLIISCYFDQIFKQPLIDLPQHGILNVHSSLLPAHRGPMPVIYNCLDDPALFGATVHAVDRQIDAGSIFAQTDYEPPPGHSVLSMMSDLHELGVDMLCDILDKIRSGQRPAEVKSQAGGSYGGFPDSEVMKRFRETGRKLYNRQDLARAFRTPMSM